MKLRCMDLIRSGRNCVPPPAAYGSSSSPTVTESRSNRRYSSNHGGGELRLKPSDVSLITDRLASSRITQACAKLPAGVSRIRTWTTAVAGFANRRVIVLAIDPASPGLRLRIPASATSNFSAEKPIAMRTLSGPCARRNRISSIPRTGGPWCEARHTCGGCRR